MNTNVMMTMYHSSATAKKVMSEQFLSQLKAKTEVENIKWQYQTMMEKDSRATQQREQNKRRKTNNLVDTKSNMLGLRDYTSPFA